MKPHSLRKVLWLLNLGLAAAVVGVAAWFFLDVRPAVAKVVDQGRKQPKNLQAMRKDYESMRVTGLKWAPQAPVSDKEIEETILRPDYKKRKPTHWIFSGPLPPPITTDAPTGPAKPPAPEGLEALGKVSLVLTDPDGSKTILFSFSGGSKSGAFGLGEFVRASRDEDGRFRITDIVELRDRVWEVRYDVFGDDAAKPERQGKLVWDESQKGPPAPFLRPVGPEQPLAAKKSGDAEPAAGSGTAKPAEGEGASGESATENGEEEAAEPKVIDAGNKPAEDLTLTDLKPILHRDPRNSRRRAIEFDRNTYRYFRGKKARTIAETVKTQVQKDPQTGRVLGLRITGFDENAPADVFDVRRGDILVSINGQKVNSRSEAISIGQKLDPDKLVTVVIDRNGRLLTYKVDPRDPQTKRRVRYFENLR